MEDQGARVAAGAASTSAPDDGIPASSAGPAIDVVGLAEKTSLMQRRICCGRMTVSTAIKLALLLALVLGIVLGLTVGNLDEKIGDLFEWVDENRAPGIFIFFGVYSLCTAVFFPSSILTLAGGAIFGFWGIPLVWVSATVGQTLAFFLSRYLLRSWVAGWSEKYRIWNAVEAALHDQGLKIVTLLRLATVIPYSATNALLPITSVTFWQYTIGSAIGIIPGVCLYTMIGRLASSIAEVVNGNVETNPVVLIVSIVVSILVLVVVVVLLTRYAKKALRAQLEEEATAEEGSATVAVASPPTSADAEGGRSGDDKAGRRSGEGGEKDAASVTLEPMRLPDTGHSSSAHGDDATDDVAVDMPVAR